MKIMVAGFDWDEGNWPKCGKHGVSREEVVFMLKMFDGQTFIRPISARYMHKREIEHYENR